MWSTDINVSAYYGPDLEPVFRPIGTDVSSPGTPKVVVQPQYFNSPAIGLSLSRSFGDFVFQAEATYNPMKAGVVDQDLSVALPQFPYEIKRFHAIRSSLGFNYFIPFGDIFEWHEGDAVFTVEWSRPTNFASGLIKPLIQDVLIMRIEDTFIDNSLKVTFTSILDITEVCYILMPEVSYQFDNGISLSAAYAYIGGEGTSFIGLYSDNDLVKIKVRYEYKI